MLDLAQALVAVLLSVPAVVATLVQLQAWSLDAEQRARGVHEKYFAPLRALRHLPEVMQGLHRSPDAAALERRGQLSHEVGRRSST